MRRSAIALALLFACAARAQELSDQKFAYLGDFILDSGVIMRECRVGYRTAGELNATRSNAVLFPTWFAGRSADAKGWVGPGKVVDTRKYFAIAIDAFGDGVSSSPSNSTQRPFPQFSMRDMVRAQHQLVTRELKLDQLYAVVGFSMGGMQVFQWAVTYPNFMKRAVSISGTPRQTSSDILLWRSELDALDGATDVKKAMRTVATIQSLELTTPAHIARTVPDADKEIETHAKAIDDRDPLDYMTQLRAMIAHDVGSIDSIKAKMLIIVALQDQMVNPAPSREAARKLGAELVTLSGDCGHLAAGCERDLVVAEVQKFLERP